MVPLIKTATVGKNRDASTKQKKKNRGGWANDLRSISGGGYLLNAEDTKGTRRGVECQAQGWQASRREKSVFW